MSGRKGPIISLPGHNYLGPGNQSELKGNRLKAVDEDDRIAADHDNEYELSKTKEYMQLNNQQW